MKVGISIPASLTDPDIILDWAQRVDKGPYSTLSVLDRVVYSNPDPLLTLTMAAAASRRVRLMTEILISPVRNGTLLAKEAATLDVFSRGRLTLGLGVGQEKMILLLLGQRIIKSVESTLKSRSQKRDMFGQESPGTKIPALSALLPYRAVDLKSFLVVLFRLCSNVLLASLTVL